MTTLLQIYLTITALVSLNLLASLSCFLYNKNEWRFEWHINYLNISLGMFISNLFMLTIVFIWRLY